MSRASWSPLTVFLPLWFAVVLLLVSGVCAAVGIPAWLEDHAYRAALLCPTPGPAPAGASCVWHERGTIVQTGDYGRTAGGTSLHIRLDDGSDRTVGFNGGVPAGVGVGTAVESRFFHQDMVSVVFPGGIEYRQTDQNPGTQTWLTYVACGLLAIAALRLVPLRRRRPSVR